MERILARYYDASNAKINKAKSTVLFLKDCIDTGYSSFAGEPIRHLGYFFDASGLTSAESFWPPFIASLNATISYFNRPGLSLTARKLAFASYILPKVLYRSNMCPPRRGDIKDLTRVKWRYIYNDSRVIVARDRAICPVTAGGLDLPLMDSLFQAQSLKWVYEFFSKPEAVWVKCLSHILKTSYRRMSGINVALFPFGQDPLPPRVSLPSPWMSALQTWKQLHGRLREPQHFEALLSQPLFNNPFLPVQRAYSGFRTLFQRGIGKIGELWNINISSWSLPTLANFRETDIQPAEHGLARLIDLLDHWTELPSDPNHASEAEAYEFSTDDGLTFTPLTKFKFNECYRKLQSSVLSQSTEKCNSQLGTLPFLLPDFGGWYGITGNPGK